MSSHLEELKILEYFNEKVDKLLSLTFTDFVSTKVVKLKISAKLDSEVKVEHIIPGSESFDAFVLTFRFFIQDNEPISIRKMHGLYQNLPISDDIKQKFNDARNSFNSFLDRFSPLKVKDPITKEEKRFTYRYIMDIFIYGGYAHGSRKTRSGYDLKKREIYKRMMSKPIFSDFALHSFSLILSNSMMFLIYIKSLNISSIKEIQA